VGEKYINQRSPEESARYTERTTGSTAKGNPNKEKRVIAGNTISLVRGLPEMVEKSANDEKATAKGVKLQRKFEEDERYPILRRRTSS
jgi:hypothetical protein